MEEIKNLHDIQVEWGNITNLMDRISLIEGTIPGGWPELIDIVVDAISEEEENDQDPRILFLNLYLFLFRLYYRVKANPVRRPFNVIRQTQDEDGDKFTVINYDYNMFKWMRKNGFANLIANDYAVIPGKRMDTKTRLAFERKAKLPE